MRDYPLFQDLFYINAKFRNTRNLYLFLARLWLAISSKPIIAISLRNQSINKPIFVKHNKGINNLVIASDSELVFALAPRPFPI